MRLVIVAEIELKEPTEEMQRYVDAGYSDLAATAYLDHLRLTMNGHYLRTGSKMRVLSALPQEAHVQE